MMQSNMGWDDPQKRMYLRYGGDGIADMIVGSAFLGIGLMLYSDMPFVPVWLVIFLMPVSWGLKRLITMPRLSEEEARALHKEEGPAIQTIKWAATAGVLLLAATVLLTARSPGLTARFPGPYLMWALIGLSLVSIFVILGLLYRAWRWAFYALLVVPVMLLMATKGLEFPFVLAGLGGVILTAGLLVAGHFVTTHPRL